MNALLIAVEALGYMGLLGGAAWFLHLKGEGR